MRHADAFEVWLLEVLLAPIPVEGELASLDRPKGEFHHRVGESTLSGRSCQAGPAVV